jgi:hypothetical protein
MKEGASLGKLIYKKFVIHLGILPFWRWTSKDPMMGFKSEKCIADNILYYPLAKEIMYLFLLGTCK